MIALIAAPTALVVAFFSLWIFGRGPQQEASLCPPAPRIVGGEALIGGDFTLVNQFGEEVTASDLEGKPTLIFFGYTFCPDFCPFSLQAMAVSLDMLSEEERARYQTVFITIDPERDTVEQLAAYVDSPAFPDGLIGLTGTPEQIAEAADAYRVVYQRAEVDSAADYLMDHSTLTYLMRSDGGFGRVFRHGESPAVVADCLKDFLEEDQASS